MAARLLAPRRRRSPRPRTPIQSVVDETIALYQWLAWVADRLYGEEARGASRRWILRRLDREGPRTVSGLARLRSVRRQSLQPIVDTMVSERLLVLVANPNDARAPLVALSTRGRAVVTSLDRIDAAVLRAVSRGIDADALSVTATTLGSLRAAFETKMRWQPAAEAARTR
ncbi:MAG: hypothetical protein HOV80_37985 [Polyangiaceae bacterium]|nr:hypothetical protein [Polyangiaceae bacterium]